MLDFAEQVYHTKRELLSIPDRPQGEGARGFVGMVPRVKVIRCSTIVVSAPISSTLPWTRNPYKHGRYTPGMHIPIYPVAAIDEARPDYLLILPWNLKQEIVSQMGHVGNWAASSSFQFPALRSLIRESLQHESCSFLRGASAPVFANIQRPFPNQWCRSDINRSSGM